MNVDTIIITQDEALAKLNEYAGLTVRQFNEEDERLRQLYKAVSKGARVLNIANAFRETGLNEQGHPNLAIARADWKDVRCRLDRDGAAKFSDRNSWRTYAADITLSKGTFTSVPSSTWIKSAVPHIPPAIRPKISLSNFHILFEVDQWEQDYPVDPFLLRRIQGDLFVVIAEWELTPLEASLLGAMRQGN
jgi:hypothetical protein